MKTGVPTSRMRTGCAERRAVEGAELIDGEHRLGVAAARRRAESNSAAPATASPVAPPGSGTAVENEPSGFRFGFGKNVIAFA